MEKAKKPWYKRWWAITLFIIIGIGILNSLFGNSNSSTSSNNLQTSTQQQKIIQTPPTFLKKTYDDLWAIFSPESKYTDLQKDKIFNEEYKGRYVKWAGRVIDVDTNILNNLRLMVEHRSKGDFDFYGGDVTVYMKEEQYNRLLELSKGDTVTYIGRFKSYGEFVSVHFTLDDGEVIG